VDGRARSRHRQAVRIPAALAAAGLLTLGALGASARADRLAPDDLAHKRTGGYVTGLPLASYSTDIGLGLGARVYGYWDGHPDDPRFGETPYLYRIFLQAFASTRGIQVHWLDLDAPRILDSPYRIRSQLIYARNINNNYFGLGERALAPLAFPGQARTYGSYADYTRDQQRIGRDGQTYSKYDQYDLVRPVFIAGVERLFDHDRVRVLAGFGVSYGGVHDYTGKSVDAVDAAGADTHASEAPTRLAQDCAARRLVGCGGGRDDYLRLGISYDTRDFEPDPNTGAFFDLAIDAGTAALGSQFDYVRVMGAARGYWSPIPELADLVPAAWWSRPRPTARRSSRWTACRSPRIRARGSAATARCAGSARTASSAA
jgi:surface antigen Omp85-like protein